MQWDTTVNAGFSTAIPWLPVNVNFKLKNARTESEDPNSLMNFYKRLILLRMESQVLRWGSLNVDKGLSTTKVLVYQREFNGEKYLILLNFTGRTQPIPELNGKIMLSTVADFSTDALQPFEARVLEVGQ